MSTTGKDTIYIDVDDEITAVIEKVQASTNNVVALVLPKRATVMQSTVNMRLLKRAAENAKKSLVLITSEAALLPLAGAVGLHVARSLQSKPAIPPAPELKDQPLTIADESLVDEVDTGATDAMETVDPRTPVGTLAGDTAAEAPEIIDVDNTKPVPKKAAAGKTKKTKGDKKLKVPNFERFRKWLLLGGVALVAFIIFLIWAFVFAPKASITVTTDTTNVSSDLDMTASPNTQTLDASNRIVPATAKQSQQTASVQVPATGQQNNGQKASGTMTIINCQDSNALTIPAGTTFTSNSLVFASTQDVSVPGSSFKKQGNDFVCQQDGTNTVKVQAQSPGDNYNLSARSYSVGVGGDFRANGSAMSGGSNQIVKIVSQSDVDDAKQQLLDKTKAAATSDLNKQFSSASMFAISDSVAVTGDSAVTASPDVGQQADQTTVNMTTTYSMLGVQQSDLKKLIEADIKTKIDTNAQKIQNSDDGLGKAIEKAGDKKSNGDVPFNLQVQITAGEQQNTDAIKQLAKGRKKGDAQDAIKQRPGVKDAVIHYSPFWVTTTPSKTSRITVLFKQANGSQ